MGSPSSINTRKRSVRGVNQSHVFGVPLNLLGHISDSRGISCTVPVGCASGLEIPLVSGGRPPRL